MRCVELPVLNCVCLSCQSKIYVDFVDFKRDMDSARVPKYLQEYNINLFEIRDLALYDRQDGNCLLKTIPHAGLLENKTKPIKYNYLN